MELGVQNSQAALGIIPFKPAAQLERETAEKKAKANKEQESPFISNLSAYIDSCWESAKSAKLDHEVQMAKSLRQRNGIYEPEKLAAIKEMGGSEVFVLLTSTKCRAAEAWINDILRPALDRPFTLKATPVPDLPGDIEAKIKNNVFQVAQEVIEQAEAANMQIHDQDLTEKLAEYASRIKDEAFDALNKEARKRIKRMSDEIADQMIEGGWNETFWGVISDFCTLKAGILKGPVLRSKKTKKWRQDQQGQWIVGVEEKVVPEFDRVSPFDIYPAPDSRGPNDGYLIERHRIARQNLQELIGVDGYSEENIRKALRDYSGGLVSTLAIDSDRNVIEFGESSSPEMKSEKIEALEYWGPVRGKLLKEWGLKETLDEDLDYEVNVWKVGEYVIKAVLNPDQVGRKPYFVDSYERVAGSFWGKGIPELMEDVQEICNAVARAIVNNSALASGPQVEVNVDRADDSEKIYPWKIWQSDNSQMSESPAVRFYQPNIVVNELMRVFEFFSVMSEDQTGVPRWAYGNSDIGGAGNTSSGLSMLMGHASKGIKESISHLDGMISGCVEMTYDYNMLNATDENIKGDCTVVARGSSSLAAKEQQIVRMRELLQATNNPTDMEIIGIEGRAKLLQAATKDILNGENIVPTDEDQIMAIVEKIRQREQAMLAQGMGEGPKGAAPPPNPQTLDPAGNPAGGVDANLFQNPAGVTQ